jgi:hypothetical protein
MIQQKNLKQIPRLCRKQCNNTLFTLHRNVSQLWVRQLCHFGSRAKCLLLERTKFFPSPCKIFPISVSLPLQLQELRFCSKYLHRLNKALQLQLSGLIGTASRPDMQKIRITGFFFGNKPHWQFEVAKKFYKRLFLSYIFIYVQIKH